MLKSWMIIGLLLLSTAFFALNYSNAVSTGMNSWIQNPAFLTGDPDCGVSYLFDYEDNIEQRLTLRFPKYFGYTYDFEHERYYIGGSFSPLRNLHTGLLYSRKDQSEMDFGMLYRPFNQVSLGCTVFDLTHEKPDMHLGMAVRPYRDYLTLYAEQEIFWNYTDEQYDRDHYFLGAILRPFNGIEIDGNYDKDEHWQIMLRVGLDHLSVGYLASGKEDIRYGSRQIVTWSAFDQQSVFTPGSRMQTIEIKGKLADSDDNSFFHKTNSDIDILRQIRNAAKDPKITNLLLHIQQPDATFAQIDEIRTEITRFRQYGKVACYLDYADLKSLYLASAADYIVVSPAACVDLSDPGQTVLSFGGLLSELNIDVQTWQMGDQNFGDEPLTEASLSAEARAQLLRLRSETMSTVIQTLMEARGLQKSPSELPAPMTASQALEAGLIDEEGYIASARRFLKPSKPFPEPQLAGLKNLPKHRHNWSEESRIALISIEGNILPGDDRDCLLPLPAFGGKIAGLDSIMDELDRAENGRYKAIVIRIDSGGGDVAAVTALWNRIRELNRRKPVIVSCSGICTSGAYYLALPAERVFADNFTISGGFGTTAYRFDADGLFNKLKINGETLNVNRGTDSNYQDMTSVYYRQLLTRISSSRDIPMIEVNRLGQGELMIGNELLMRGLADEIGGLEDAIRYARHRSGLSDSANIETISDNRSFFDRFQPMRNFEFPLRNGFYMHSGLNRGL